jgi:flavin reductase (DIM6/NTAB) family NADH-FMN oxidoreductase RutF
MSLDAREFRNALGCFATGVCVITADPDGYEPFGMTVNSFASVSLDPPLVLWSLQNDSEMYAAWEKTRRFAVNILRSDQMDMSNQYAKKGDHALTDEHWIAGDTGVPIIPESLASFECEMETTHPGGDHIIVLGRVVAMHNRENGSPLLFCSGAYRELAEA